MSVNGRSIEANPSLPEREFSAEKRPPPVAPVSGKIPRLYLLALLVCFLAFYALTSPDYVGDTVRWSDDAIGHAEGRPTQFWEFGHLLWRPWAYIGYILLHGAYERIYSDTALQSVARFLIQTDFVCSLATVLLLFWTLRRLVHPAIALFSALALDCSTAFLNYSHSGAPYIPALFFSLLSFHWLTRALEQSSPRAGERDAVVAGIAFSVASALWFPYALSGLGMLATIQWWPRNELAFRRRLHIAFLGALGISAILLFAGGASANGIRTPGQLMHWIHEADNGWQQSATAMRAVTGFPRSVWNFSSDTVFLKRALWSDPFNPVNFHQSWVLRLGAKLAVYYLALAATLLVLWNERRDLLYILGAAAIPILFFAAVIFEPSSPERLFPIFPFAFVAFAIAMNRPRRHVLASGCVAILCGGIVTSNLVANWRSNTDARLLATHRRIDALNSDVRPGALVFVMTLNDDLYFLTTQTPLDHSLALSRFNVLETVAIAGQLTAKWRPEFARRTLDLWDHNREVWISERLLAAKPASEWKWVEGDDRRIHWPELPAMFSALQFDKSVLAGKDGFRRVSDNAANRTLLMRMSNSASARL